MTVALFYGHATSNLGDVALNTGAERLVGLAGARVSSAVFPPVGPDRLRHGIESFRQLEHPVPLYADATSRDALIEYCGHPERFFRHYNLELTETVLIHSGEHFFTPADARARHPFLFWRVLPALAAKATGRRVVVLPSTFGPFGRDPVSRLLTGTLDLVDELAAREARSVRLAERWSGRGIAAVLDPAFFAGTARARSAASGRLAIAMRLEESGLRAGAARSAEALRAAVDSGFRDSTAWRLTNAIVAALARGTGGASVDIVAQALADDELATGSLEALREAGAGRIGVVRAHGLSVDEYLELLSGYDMVVSSRFHASVLSLSQAVPSVGIALAGHGHKLPGLFELLGVPRYAFTADGSTSDDDLADRIVERSRDAEGFHGVWDRVAELKTRTVEWLGHAMTSGVRDRRRRARDLLRLMAGIARDDLP